MALNARQLAILGSLAQVDHLIGAGYCAALAFPDAEYRGRRDAGATRTLDGLQRLGLVKGTYGRHEYGGGRDWEITDEGRLSLREVEDV